MRYLITVLSIVLLPQVLAASEVNVYTSRHYDSDAALYSEFTDLTDIKVNVISGKAKALEKRIEEEGKDCKGDLYIVADAGRLYSIYKKGLFNADKSDETQLLGILNPLFKSEELSKNEFSNLLKIKINKSLIYLEYSLLLIKNINQKLIS